MNARLGQGHFTFEEVGIVHFAVVHILAVEGLGTFGWGWQRHVVWSEPAIVLKHTACVFALLVVHFSLCISCLTNEDTKKPLFPISGRILRKCRIVFSSRQQLDSPRGTLQPVFASLPWVLSLCLPSPVLSQDPPWPHEQLQRCMVWSGNPCSRWDLC